MTLIETPSLSRYWAFGLLVLVAASYRMWLPTGWVSHDDLPPVPIADFPVRCHDAYSWLVLPIMVMGCGLASRVIGGTRDRLGWSIIGLTLLVGVALDQHRLQPWVYQTVLYAGWFVLLPARNAVRWMQVLTISIYLYSSIGKFDYQFIHTVGQDFLVTAGSFVGADVTAWDESVRWRVVLAFPLFELMTSILLIIPRTRRVGGCFAIAMHFSLMMLLSPWGMNHSLGVLAWNAVLSGQAYLLFVAAPPNSVGSKTISVTSGNHSWRRAIAGIMLVVALVLPLSERRDREDDSALHWDHWLSWALYSPHNSRFHFEVHRSLVSEFPDSWTPAVGEDTDADGWYELDLGRLALEIRGVPAVPQSRYQLGLAIAIARSHEVRESVRGVLRSSSRRLDGSRRDQWLNNLDAMTKASRAFWLLDHADTDRQ